MVYYTIPNILRNIGRMMMNKTDIFIMYGPLLPVVLFVIVMFTGNLILLMTSFFAMVTYVFIGIFVVWFNTKKNMI